MSDGGDVRAPGERPLHTRTYRRLTLAADWLSQVLGVLAGAALFALMVLTFCDVIGRKFYYSVPGALELSEMLMVVTLFGGLPLVAWHAEHVCFELADSLYKGAAARWSRVFMDLVCTLVFGALGVACWRFAGRTMEDHEISVYLNWPIGWFVYLMAALILCAAAMHLLRALTVDNDEIQPHPNDLPLS